MPSSQRLRLHDIRQIHELIARIAEFGERPDIWRRIALEGLIHIVGGNVGLTVDMKVEPQGSLQWLDPIDTGWQTESVRRRFGEYVSSGEMAADPAMRAVLSLRSQRPVLISTRRELVEDGDWYRASSVSEGRKMGDVDDFLLSLTTRNGSGLHGWILYRPWKARPFEERHRRIMRLFRLELRRAIRESRTIRPLHGELPPLSPRQRQMLELLLSPLSGKQIAAKMGLSRHTANDYQKSIHRIFNVNSRPELIYQFRPIRQRICSPEDIA
jgi:DNA-binding CsgD family transcriptional regulator